MERNFWEKIKESFFDDNEEKINDRKSWENCIENKESYRYALQLLAIAYFESRDKGDFEGSYGKYINSNYPEFEYRYFSQHRRDLLDQLRKFGVALLKHGNDCQYLRTILKYSGKMCVNIAKNISENVHSWDEEQVKNQIKKYLENFKASFSDSTERDQAFEDAQNIFLTIAKQCRTNNQPPTLEELLDLQIDLTANIITQIHSILFNKEKSNFETRPTIKIDRGKAFFTLPEGKDAIFREEIERALFEFKFSQNRITAFEYKKVKDNWQKNHLCGNIQLPVEKIEEVRLLWWDKGNNKHSENVLPEICSHDFIIIDAKQKPVTQLTVGEEYCLIPLQKAIQSIICIKDDETCEELPFAEGRFRVPEKSVILKINEFEIPLKNSCRNWLNTENMPCAANGSRLFLLASDEDSILDSNADSNSIYVKYGDQEIFSRENTWQKPELWQKESLKIYRENECILTYPVTFIDDININGTLIKEFNPLPMDEECDLEISIGENKYQYRLAAGEKYITINHRGFDLRIRIPRIGAYLELPETEILLHPAKPHCSEGIVWLAKDDFSRAKCHIENSAANNIQFARGNDYFFPRNSAEGKNISFKLDQFKSQDYTGSRDNFCSIFVSTKSVYRLRLYDPMQCRVEIERENDDLIVTYTTSFLRSSGDKYLVYYPAHLQDEPFKCIKADEAELQYEDGKKLKQLLRFKDLYKRDDINWGKGFIAFAAVKQSYLNGTESYRIITQGFFVKAPDEAATEIQNDPYGLRCAMADCDVDKICDIFRGTDEKQREYVAKFITGMTREMSNLDLNVFNYLNSYWNTLFNSYDVPKGPSMQSGYIFQAGWFFVNGPGENDAKNDLNDNYRPYWDYLLFADEYCEKKTLSGKNDTQEQLDFFLQMFCFNTLNDALDKLNETYSVPKHMRKFIKLVQKLSGKYDTVAGVSYHKTRSFSYAQISEFIRENISDKSKTDRLKKISPQLYEAWQKNNTATIESGKCFIKKEELEKYFSELGMENSYLFQPGYETTCCITVTEYKSFDFNMFKTALDSIAEMLNNWRKNPTLAEAQYLREILILLRNIDDEFGYNTNYVLPMREYIKNKILFMNSNN